jgi:hypothetical protein
LLAEMSALFTTVIDEEDRSTVAFMMSSVLETHRRPQVGATEHGVITVRSYLTAMVHGAVESGELSADADVPSLVTMLAALLCGISFYAVVSSGHNQDGVADRTRRLLAGTLWQIHPDQQPPD